MAIGDFFSNFQIVIRWLHVFAGIIWIGHLYFFNFVNLQLQTVLDDATKKVVNAPLMLRALWWFRWGAMITMLSGLVLFALTYMYTPGVGFGTNTLFKDFDGITGRAIWIQIGMTLGLIMWFNVWFIIWPTQKAIFSGKFAGDALAAARKKAAKFSRINTHLSGPMLFGMLAAPHYSSFNIVTLIVFMVVAEGMIHLAYKTSANVGKSV